MITTAVTSRTGIRGELDGIEASKQHYSWTCDVVSCHAWCRNGMHTLQQIPIMQLLDGQVGCKPRAAIKRLSRKEEQEELQKQECTAYKELCS